VKPRTDSAIRILDIRSSKKIVKWIKKEPNEIDQCNPKASGSVSELDLSFRIDSMSSDVSAFVDCGSHKKFENYAGEPKMEPKTAAVPFSGVALGSLCRFLFDPYWCFQEAYARQTHAKG
jgi:hypothetical protein